MFDSDEFPEKVGTEVEVTFIDRSMMRGKFFLSQTQRVSDVLNDPRKFIPFTDPTGEVRMVNKDNIIWIKPSHQRDGGRRKGTSVV